MPKPLTDDKGRTISVVGLPTKYVSTTVVVAATTNYAAGDVLSNSASVGTYLTFSDVVAQEGGSGRIVGALAIAQSTQVVFLPTLLLYKAVPTSNLNDNAANTGPSWTDRAGYIGEINFKAFTPNTGGARTEAVEGEGGIPKRFVCGDALTDIYAIVVAETAETNEKAGESYLVTLLIEFN